MSNNLIGATLAIFTVTLSAAVTEPVDVAWSTRDGTARAGTDYEATNGVITFLPGETAKQVQVTVYGQDDITAADKNFYIELSPPSNAVLGVTLIEVVISIDEEGGVAVLSLVVPQGKRGLKGDPGLSAYEHAVLMGYEGTIEQWMAEIADAEQAAGRAEGFAADAAESAVVAQQKAGEAVQAVASTKQYVDGALSNLSTEANKFYPTLAAANADIANIQLDQPVTVGEAVNGGLWYKATSGATTLTKSPFDPVEQAKNYTDDAVTFKTKSITVSGDYTLSDDDLKHDYISFSGTLTADTTITIPANKARNMNFRHNMAGGYVINLRTPTQGAAEDVVLKYGRIVEVVITYGGSAWEVGRQKANLDSPSFIGTPTAYTPTESSRDTRLATTLYVARATREFKVINLSDVDHTLTLDELGYSTVVFTGSATKDLTITFPKVQTRIAVRHAVNGGFKLNLEVLDSATTLTISVNDTIEVHNNGSRLYRIDNDRAPLASPTLTGTPKAPTPTLGTKDTQIATTEFVQRESHGSVNIQVNDDFVEITAARCQYKNIYLYGALTKNITITLGESNGSWNIQNATTGGFSIILKSTNAPTIILPSGAMRKVFAIGGTVKQITVDGATLAPASVNALGGIKVGSGLAITPDGTLSAIGGGGGGGSGITNYKGNFKAYGNYEVGDIVEHGSGIYECVLDVTNVVTPLNNSAFLKKSSNLYAGANRSISTINNEVTSLEDKKPISFVANDGTTCFSYDIYRYLYRSLDFGQTWEEFHNFGNGKVGAIKQLANNELLVAFNNAATTPQIRELWLTNGYGTDTVTWSKVFEVQREGIYFAQGWSFSTYKNLVFAIEYGPKYTPGQTGSSLEGENARYAYMSKDSGKTWSICFDLNSLTDGVGVHTHGICYDEYWQRIWVSHGDGFYGSNGLWYSDDLGETWVSALQTQGPGANWTQCVGQYSLPTCLIFASDSSPNGIYRIDRAQGKYPAKGYFDIEVGYQIPHADTENLNYLSHANIKTAFTPDPIYLFAFSPETRDGQSHIVATYNGWDYFPLWTDDVVMPRSRGVINIEMNAKNEIIGTSNDERFGTDIKPQVKLKVKME